MGRKRVEEGAAEPDKPKRVNKPTKTGPPLRGEGVVSPLATLFREKIRASGLSNAELARATGIDHTVIFRFLKEERDLNSYSYYQLMTALGGEIVFKTKEMDEPTLA